MEEALNLPLAAAAERVCAKDLSPVALADAVPGEPLQFERQGYFCLDPDATPGRPVFNRTVALRDSWARIQGKDAA